MPLRKRRLDHALRSPQRGIWIATVAILVAGGIAIWFATASGERGRLQLLERLEPGDSAQRVVALLGEPPRTCPTGRLDHLRTQFPPGWAPASVERALERLQAGTAQRWIYPLEGREAGCTPPQGVTEIGMGHDQRVLWYVPITGKQRLELPPQLTPDAIDTPDEETDA